MFRQQEFHEAISSAGAALRLIRPAYLIFNGLLAPTTKAPGAIQTIETEHAKQLLKTTVCRVLGSRPVGRCCVRLDIIHCQSTRAPQQEEMHSVVDVRRAQPNGNFRPQTGAR